MIKYIEKDNIDKIIINVTTIKGTKIETKWSAKYGVLESGYKLIIFTDVKELIEYFDKLEKKDTSKHIIGVPKEKCTYYTTIYDQGNTSTILYDFSNKLTDNNEKLIYKYFATKNKVLK